jgi:spermidine synthase
MHRGRFGVLVALFFCSGACGLVYQVLWLRQLSLVFGVTVYAASTVLAAFMTGLAIGSLGASRVLAHVRRPLAAFGVAEILIGALALASPAVLAAAGTVYEALYRAAPDALGRLTAGRFLSSFLVLLVPTALMGLTFPLLSASSLVRGPRLPARVSLLYASNTAGAVTGAILAGFHLIGDIGMRRTFLLAAAVNAGVGLAALALARRADEPPRPALAESARSPAAPAAEAAARLATAPDPRLRRAIALVIFTSGAAALALEIVWFRILLQFLTGNTYAFTTMLATLLAGIATGGAVAARVLAKPRDWHWILVRVLFATGIAVVASLVFLAWSYGAGWRTSSPIQACAAALFPASLLMGVAFPIALRLGALATPEQMQSRRAIARGVGGLYAVNMAGAILGAVAGGFLVLPWLGSRGALVALAAVYVISAVGLFGLHPLRRGLALKAAVRVAVFVGAAAFVPDPFLAAIERRHGVDHREIWRHEGVQTAVSVHARGPNRVLFLDGLHQASDLADIVLMHRVIGHLPMLLHPDPRDVLVVGLGGGTTAGAISRHAQARLLIVELSHSVRLAADRFAHVNYDVLKQPNVQLRVDDGRNFLTLTDRRFDVITADVIQPTLAGAGNLYSREYFALVRKTLRPAGLALQWIGQRPEDHYKAVMRTFLEVFPHATLWYGGNLLVGSVEPLTVDLGAVERRLADPALRPALDAIGAESIETVRGWFTAGPDAMRRYVGPGVVLTDDRPALEYDRSLPGGAPEPNLSGVASDPASVFVPHAD